MADFADIHARLGRVFDREVVFVTGATRWGTAWLMSAIDSHPQASCQGEGHFSDTLFPMLLKTFDRYNAQVETHSRRLGLAGLPESKAGFTYDDVDHLMATAAGLMMDRWLESDSVKVIGDKTPEHVLALDLLHRAIPHAKVVHVVRDGRDEAVSAWDFNARVSGGEFNKRFPQFADFAEYFAKNWSKSVGAARRFGRENRDHYFQIFAEDLARSPEKPLGRLCRFLGLDDMPDILRRMAADADRLARPDVTHGLWRERFDDAALRSFRRQAGELLKLLDYPE